MQYIKIGYKCCHFCWQEHYKYNYQTHNFQQPATVFFKKNLSDLPFKNVNGFSSLTVFDTLADYRIARIFPAVVTDVII